MQKSSQLHFSGFKHGLFLSAGPGILVCLPGPLSPFHYEFHGSQVVPALDWFLSDLAVNIDVWLGPRQSCQLEYLYMHVAWLPPNM